ncbi:MAG: tyrosine-type recombinase/integrase [Candidatus Omnitrophota bacterium]|nr:tyrosine-type recombinase/integrase [Candidatus Omnitrophota bacterium]MDZ4242205.1 tyrosine-type recombinase/integrase [Candidatus Omnitrophota bacterium]
MGLVKKIGNEYYVEFEARGLKYHQKAGSDAAEARRLLAAIEAKIAAGELQAVSRDVDIDIFFQECLEFCRSRFSVKTADRIASAARHFMSYLNGSRPDITKVSQITPAVMEQYRRAFRRGTGVNRNSAGRRNLTLLLLFEAFEYAIKTGALNDNPLFHVRLETVVARSYPRFLSPSELSRLFSSSRDADCPWVEFMLLSGLRPRELAGMHWDMVDWDGNTVSVAAHPGQGSTVRQVPLSAAARELLEKLRQCRKGEGQGHVFPRGKKSVPDGKIFSLEFSELRNRCNISQDISISSLRHAFAADCLRQGISLPRVCQILGINDVAKGMIYASQVPVERGQLRQS